MQLKTPLTYLYISFCREWRKCKRILSIHARQGQVRPMFVVHWMEVITLHSSQCTYCFCSTDFDLWFNYIPHGTAGSQKSQTFSLSRSMRVDSIRANNNKINNKVLELTRSLALWPSLLPLPLLKQRHFVSATSNLMNYDFGVINNAVVHSILYFNYSPFACVCAVEWSQSDPASQGCVWSAESRRSDQGEVEKIKPKTINSNIIWFISN